MLYITKCVKLIKPVNGKNGKFQHVAQKVNIFLPKAEKKCPDYIASIWKPIFCHLTILGLGPLQLHPRTLLSLNQLLCPSPSS